MFLLALFGAGIFWFNQASAPAARPSSNLPLAAETPRRTTVLLTGDIMLSRNVGAKIDAANNPSLPFQNLQDNLQIASLTFGNLECPLSENPNPLGEGLVFRCLARFVTGLVTAGFDVLSTANNHALDQGEKNVDYTIDYLASQNILPVGTGHDFAEAHAGQILPRNGIKFGFLSYSYTALNDGGKSTNPKIADFNDTPQMQKDVAALRERTDIVIVNMHAGIEYTRLPTPTQIKFAHAAIDAGADVVVGEHSHWIQNIDTYQGKPVFYGLGNFVFDQSWSEETKEGLTVKLNFQGKQLQSADLLPVIIENNFQPRPATAKETQAILQKISATSTIINF